MRYFIHLSYDGERYHGWQIQPNGNTVQETLQKALTTLLRHDTEIVGAGRTDAGVNAKHMVAHFDHDAELDPQLVYRLNKLLPPDIAIYKIEHVADDMHARFSASFRMYKYFVTLDKSPFARHYTYRYPQPLDFELMNEAAKVLFEYSDFTSFSKLHTDTKTNICRIMHAEWTREGEGWVFTIQADRFLRNMVRAVVGTLLEVGRGKLTIEGFRRIIEGKDRCMAGTSVPGNALFLWEVGY